MTFGSGTLQYRLIPRDICYGCGILVLMLVLADHPRDARREFFSGCPPRRAALYASFRLGT